MKRRCNHSYLVSVHPDKNITVIGCSKCERKITIQSRRIKTLVCTVFIDTLKTKFGTIVEVIREQFKRK